MFMNPASSPGRAWLCGPMAQRAAAPLFWLAPARSQVPVQVLPGPSLCGKGLGWPVAPPWWGWEAASARQWGEAPFVPYNLLLLLGSQARLRASPSSQLPCPSLPSWLCLASCWAPTCQVGWGAPEVSLSSDPGSTGIAQPQLKTINQATGPGGGSWAGEGSAGRGGGVPVLVHAVLAGSSAQLPARPTGC